LARRRKLPAGERRLGRGEVGVGEIVLAAMRRPASVGGVSTGERGAYSEYGSKYTIEQAGLFEAV
jgi:hypothetical protein